MLEMFEEWLRGKLDSEETLKRYLSYANKLHLKGCNPQELKSVALIVRNQSKWYKNTLRNWVTLCYELGEITFEEMYRIKKLLSGNKNVPIPKVQHIKLTRSDVERVNSYAKPYLLLLYYSGARGTEIIEAKKRINELYCEGDICWIELNWLRGSKRVYIIFAPKKVWEELKEAPSLSIHYLKKVGRELGGLKILRKNWYQRCTEFCDSKICDFIQGRTNVSTRHYLDSFKKAKECYSVIRKELEGDISIKREIIHRLREAVLKQILLSLGEF